VVLGGGEKKLVCVSVPKVGGKEEMQFSFHQERKFKSAIRPRRPSSHRLVRKKKKGKACIMQRSCFLMKGSRFLPTEKGPKGG